MKALDSLIRLHRWKADEKRREMAGLESMRDDLLTRRSMLEAEIRSEQAICGEPVVQFSYAAYLKAAMARRETLGQSIAEIERAIEEKQSELAAAVRELKKFEVAAARRAEQAGLEFARREQIENDEIALNVFRQQN